MLIEFTQSKDNPTWILQRSRVGLRDKIWLFRLQAVERFNRSQVEAQKRSTKVQVSLRHLPAQVCLQVIGVGTQEMQLKERHCWTVVQMSHLQREMEALKGTKNFQCLWCLKKMKSPMKGMDFFQFQGEVQLIVYMYSGVDIFEIWPPLISINLFS